MIFIFVTLFIDILGLGIIIPVLPELIREFTGGDGSRAGLYYGVIIALYALMQFVFAPVLGALSDRFGRRPIILGSLFGFGVDYLVQGFAPSIGWLFVGRAVAGVMGASVTTANAYIADVSTPENRARNYGFVGVAFGLGFIFGPALGGLLGGIHLRLPFFVAAGLALVNWLYGYFVLPESLPRDQRSPVSWGRMNPFGSLRRLRAYPARGGHRGGLHLRVARAAGPRERVGAARRLPLRVGRPGQRPHPGPRRGHGGLGAGAAGAAHRRPPRRAARDPPRHRRLDARVPRLRPRVGGVGGAGHHRAGVGRGGRAPDDPGAGGGRRTPVRAGKIQGALTSLISLTAIAAPLLFTAGLFSFFTSERAPIQLPGAPFLLGAVLFAVSLILLVRLFRRIPEPATGRERLTADAAPIDKATAVAADRA